MEPFGIAFGSELLDRGSGYPGLMYHDALLVTAPYFLSGKDALSESWRVITDADLEAYDVIKVAYGRHEHWREV